MTEKIRVLVVRPGEEPQSRTADNTLEAFSKIVGGSLEAGVYLPQRVMLFQSDSDEGTALLCGFEGDRYISLSPKQEEQFREFFSREVSDE